MKNRNKVQTEAQNNNIIRELETEIEKNNAERQKKRQNRKQIQTDRI